jgi:hypothetical protein
VAHFDRAIPPGGEGKITLTVDLSGYDGPVKKDATVKSNDPEKSSFTLTVKGTVKPLFQVRPGNSISFRGTGDQVKDVTLEISTMSQPFHIQKVESNLEGKVSHQLETVAEGQSYRLKVGNLLKEGNYSGALKLITDLPGGKSVVIRISGRIEGEINVNPKSIFMGKHPSQELIAARTVSVRSNRKKPFQITKLSYDENLIKVDAQPLPDKSGYNLVVSVRMPNVPSGNSVETTITVQTDLDPEAKQEIQVRLINQAN